MKRQPRRSTHCISSAASEVYKSQRHPGGRDQPAEKTARRLDGPLEPGQAAPPAAAPAQANLDALPTPLEAYTRRQKYSKREAQAMMVSGNKAVADIGNGEKERAYRKADGNNKSDCGANADRSAEY